jgi:hypothetical protein
MLGCVSRNTVMCAINIVKLGASYNTPIYLQTYYNILPPCTSKEVHKASDHRLLGGAAANLPVSYILQQHFDPHLEPKTKK